MKIVAGLQLPFVQLPSALVETSADPRLPSVLEEAALSSVVVSEHMHSRIVPGYLHRFCAIPLVH